MKKLIKLLVLIVIVGLLAYTFRSEIGEFVESKIGKDGLENVENGTRKAVEKGGEILKQGVEKGKEALDSLNTED